MYVNERRVAYILIFNRLYRYVVAVNTAYVDTDRLRFQRYYSIFIWCNWYICTFFIFIQHIWLLIIGTMIWCLLFQVRSDYGRTKLFWAFTFCNPSDPTNFNIREYLLENNLKNNMVWSKILKKPYRNSNLVFFCLYHTTYK